jgi:hypothetical protein
MPYEIERFPGIAFGFVHLDHALVGGRHERRAIWCPCARVDCAAASHELLVGAHAVLSHWECCILNHF